MTGIDVARRGLGFVAAAVLVAAMGVAAPVGAHGPAGGTGAEVGILGAGSPNAIPGSYIVVLSDGVAASASSTLSGRYGGTVRHVYSATIKGYAAEMDLATARRLAADPAVAYVAQNTRVRARDIQTDPPSWGLDRVDQRYALYDGAYMFSTTASNVNAYIIDTGIRTTHQDFGGRAGHGRDTIDNDDDATDCEGHGTHVAGTVGGAAHGVAKGVRLWAVRVMDCAGNGTDAQLIAGIDWVTANAVKPAVANMSLGGDLSLPVNQATQRSIAAGITYAIAAGNQSFDACQRSPGSTPEAITVGATTISDARASFSNFGTCVDIFAPGQGIRSTSFASNTATTSLSGTSMAAPHVAGAAALYLATHPTASPQQVRDALVNAATPGKVTNPGPGSPNALLFVDGGALLPPPPPGCGTQTNPTDIRIPDASLPVGNAIRIAECAGNASDRLTVEVHIRHQFRGDLKVDLIAPDGTVYPLKRASSTEGGSNLDATYTVNAASEPANGTWLLSVQDRSEGGDGVLDRWSLSVKG